MLKEENSPPKKKRKQFSKPDINMSKWQGEIVFFVECTKKNIQFYLEKERHLNAKLGSRIDSTETGTPVWAV